MAHTPGPWINDQGLVNGSETRARFAPGVSVDLFDADEYPAELHDEMMANAALIASAPDLLAALKWFVDDISGNHTRMIDFDANVVRARAAIAKAEGAR